MILLLWFHLRAGVTTTPPVEPPPPPPPPEVQRIAARLEIGGLIVQVDYL